MTRGKCLIIAYQRRQTNLSGDSHWDYYGISFIDCRETSSFWRCKGI